MIKLVVFVGAVFLIAIGLLSTYLSPDDLAKCKDGPTNTGSCMRADAIIAISGGNTSARTAGAIELYEAGWANTLVFSGAAADTSGPSNAQAMRSQAIQAGIPAENILVEELSQTTKENAEQTKTLFESRGISRVILVTSKYHQRRASLEFRDRSGTEVTIINHPTNLDSDWSGWWWLTPRGWWLASGELVKIIAFYTGQSH